MTDVLDGCVRLTDSSLDRGAGDFDITSNYRVLGSGKNFDGTPCFAQCILLPFKSRIGARQNGTLKSEIRDLVPPVASLRVDFRLEQRKRCFILSSCPVGIAEGLVGDRVEEHLRKDCNYADDRIGLNGIEQGNPLPRIVPQELDDRSLRSNETARVEPPMRLAKNLLG